MFFKNICLNPSYLLVSRSQFPHLTAIQVLSQNLTCITDVLKTIQNCHRNLPGLIHSYNLGKKTLLHPSCTDITFSEYFIIWPLSSQVLSNYCFQSNSITISKFAPIDCPFDPEPTPPSADACREVNGDHADCQVVSTCSTTDGSY